MGWEEEETQMFNRNSDYHSESVYWWSAVHQSRGCALRISVSVKRHPSAASGVLFLRWGNEMRESASSAPGFTVSRSRPVAWTWECPCPKLIFPSQFSRLSGHCPFSQMKKQAQRGGAILVQGHTEVSPWTFSLQNLNCSTLLAFFGQFCLPVLLVYSRRNDSVKNKKTVR